MFLWCKEGGKNTLGVVTYRIHHAIKSILKQLKLKGDLLKQIKQIKNLKIPPIFDRKTIQNLIPEHAKIYKPI